MYRNLHKDLWSVRSTTTRRVVSRLESLDLVNCEFRVSLSGRDRVLRQGRKNVHAVVRGTVSRKYTPAGAEPVGVTYNPYLSPHFRDRATNRTLVRAARVRFLSSGRAVAFCPEFAP